MTKALLRTIQAEYEHTEATIQELCEKYSCTTKDLSGYTKWDKMVLESTDTAIKLVYETMFSPNIVDHEELTAEDIEATIVVTAEDIKRGMPVTPKSLPKAARDGFEGLRLLDTKMQTQALRMLNKLDEMLDYCETTRDVRDLVASHTSIRDSYFNTKAPMINILNGDVVQGDKNALATLLSEVEDDC